MHRRAALLAVSATVVTLAGCGSTDHLTRTRTTPVPAATSAGGRSTHVISGHTTVVIRNYMFTPMHLTVAAGTKVTFHNEDATAHTATGLRRTFGSGTIGAGRSATVAFTRPGRYPYHCLFHAFMTATITVVPHQG